MRMSSVGRHSEPKSYEINGIEVVVDLDPDGAYYVTCPARPAVCFRAGTIAGALKRAEAAIEQARLADMADAMARLLKPRSRRDAASRRFRPLWAAVSGTSARDRV